MPPRLVSLAILLFWAIASSSLLIRDVLPDLLTGPPPDLRDLARASEPPGPTTWTILVADEDISSDISGQRAVGRATTQTNRPIDGHVQFISDVWFDSGPLLKGTPFEESGRAGGRLEIRSLVDVDHLGNLFQLRSAVRASGDPTELLVIEGKLDRDSIVVEARGPSLPVRFRRRFPYQARGVVQNGLGPIDRLPGLHLGQRWLSRVVSPLTGRVDEVTMEVARKNVLIHWGEELVPCFELETRTSGVTAKTWARSPDGLVIRQEVPLLFVTLIMEREPSPSTSHNDGREKPGSQP
jgi:hypothetical protein